MSTKTLVTIFVTVIVIIGIIAVIGSDRDINTNIIPGINSTSTTIISTSTTIVGTNTTTSTSTSATATTSSTSARNFVVNYTNDGFTPKEVRVRLGDTVTFVNNSTNGMWVASAPHPEHTDLPSFDEKSIGQPGTSWSYTFRNLGSWKYHDHRNPAAFGTVIVE